MTCQRFHGNSSSVFSSGRHRSSLTTTCGPDEIEMLLTSDRSVALATSCRSAIMSIRPLPSGVPGTFSNDVMK